MRKNAANTSDAILVVQKSATTDAGSGASWSTISSATVASSSLPTGTGAGDWYNASLTLTIPNDGTANSLRVYASTSAQIANTAYLELAQSQVELGSVATPFARAGGSIGGELALCQRYYEKSYPTSTNPGANTGNHSFVSSGQMVAATTGNLGAYTPFRVMKRAEATVTFYDTVGNSGKCTRTVTGVSDTANQAIGLDMITTVSGIWAYSSGTTNANTIRFHYTAEAEL
jgi:hypothetical protein